MRRALRENFADEDFIGSTFKRKRLINAFRYIAIAAQRAIPVPHFECSGFAIVGY
jgi:hypothetical protein